MANKVTISPSNERKLHTKSGNRCAICRTVLVEPGNASVACIGENAHIYGEKPGAARYDASKEVGFINSENNLIFLCCNCHKKVDTEVSNYPPDKLLAIKQEHEKWVVRQLAENSGNYSFFELEVLVSYLVSKQSLSKGSESYSLLKFKDKIKKNALQERQGYLNIGLINRQTVEDFFNKYPDTTYAERLTSIMAQKYIELRASNDDTCVVFDELWSFTCGNNKDFNYKAAGLGILTYFFEKCEVFEK